jgi:predicted enzyme related to lactoylglutathione lyase
VTQPQVRPDPVTTGGGSSGSSAGCDAHRAKEFYQAVLRVPFSSGHPGAWRTDEISPPLSIMPAQGAEPEVQLSYRVDDIAAAVQRVRAAGGHADEPMRRSFGLLAECVDDQGATFRLWQPVD